MRKTKLILLLCFISFYSLTNVVGQKLSRYIPYIDESTIIIGADIDQIITKMGLSQLMNNKLETSLLNKIFDNNEDSNKLKELLFTNKYINYNDRAYLIQYSDTENGKSPYSIHLPILDYKSVNQLFYNDSNNDNISYGDYTLVNNRNSNLHILYNKNQLIIVDDLSLDSPIFKELVSPRITLAKSILKKNIDKKDEDVVIAINLLNSEYSNKLLKSILPLSTPELTLTNDKPTYLVIGQNYQVGSFYWETSIISEDQKIHKELNAYLNKNKGKQLEYITDNTKFASNISINSDKMLTELQLLSNNNLPTAKKLHQLIQPLANYIDNEISISIQDVYINGLLPNADIKLLLQPKSRGSFNEIAAVISNEFNLKMNQIRENLYLTSIAGIFDLYLGETKDFIYITTDKSFAKNPFKVKNNIKKSRYYTKRDDSGFTLINVNEIINMPLYQQYVEKDLTSQYNNIIKMIDYIKFSVTPQLTNKVTVSFMDKQKNSLGILANIMTQVYFSK